MSQLLVQTHLSNDTVRVEAPRRSAGAILAKRCVQAAFAALGWPRLVCFVIARRVIGSRAFLSSSESIARIPGMRGVYSRQAFYRRTLRRCGQDVYFGWNSTFSMTEAEVGDCAYIGRFCSIGFAKIGDEVMLADHVQILSGGNEHGASQNGQTMHEQTQLYQQVNVGRGAWIGAGAIVMANVGEGAIVGAGAVVTRPIPPRCVAVGTPARVVRSLDEHGDLEGDL